MMQFTRTGDWRPRPFGPMPLEGYSEASTGFGGMGRVSTSGALPVAAAMMLTCISASAPGHEGGGGSADGLVLQLTQRHKEMLACAALLGGLAGHADVKTADRYGRTRDALLDAVVTANAPGGVETAASVRMKRRLETRAARYLALSPRHFSIDAAHCERRYAQ